MLNRLFKIDDAPEAREAYHKTIDRLEEIATKAARVPEEAEDDALAYLAYPKELWKKIQTNNSQERLNKEIKRRTRVVGAFPSEASVMRFVGSLLAEIDSDWQVRSYIAKDKLKVMMERAESESTSGRSRPPVLSDSKTEKPMEVMAA